MAVDLVAQLGAITAALDAAEVDYALCGGLALAVHGAPRATADIDLLVPPDAVDAALSVAREEGFTFVASPISFSSGVELRRVTRILGAHALTLDVLVAAGPLEAAFATRTRVRVGAAELWVIGRDGLIAMKVLAGRHQDLADIARLQEQDG